MERTIGELVVKIKGQDDGASATIDRTKKKHESLTKAVFGANFAYDLFRKGLAFVKNALAGTWKEAAEAERVHALLVQTLINSGKASTISAKQIEQTSKAFQKISIFGDEAITTAQTTLLQFKQIGSTVFPQAAKAVLDVGSKLGDLGSAAEIVGRALERPSTGIRQLRSLNIIFTADQQKAITKMEKMGNVAGAQKIILDRLNQTYGGMSETMRGTFQGSLTALQNTFSDTQEVIGKLVTTLGKPIVNAINDILTKVNDFLESKEGWSKLSEIISGVAAAFKVIFDVAKFLVENVFKAIQSAIQPIIDAFSDLKGSINENSPALVLFGRVLEAIGFIIRFVGKTTGASIKVVINFINAISAGIDLIDKLWKAMTNPSKATLMDALKSAGKASVALDKIGKDLVNDLADIYKDAGETGGRMLTNALTKEIVIGAKTVYQETNKMLMDAYGTSQEEAMRLAAAGPLNPETAIPAANKWRDAWTKAFEETKNAFSATMSVIQQQMELFNGFHDQIFGSLQSIVNQANANATSAAENEYNSRKKYIENNVKDETERTNQLKILDEEYAAQQLKLKQEAFNATKAFSIVDTIIKTATAVVNTLATAPWPLNLVMAGIVGGLGAVQTALIAAQQPPAFASGAYVPAQPGGLQATVAEGGAGEFITPDQAPIWNMMADRIVNAINSRSPNVNNTYNQMPGQLVLRVGENDLGAALTDMSNRGKFTVNQRAIGKRG